MKVTNKSVALMAILIAMFEVFGPCTGACASEGGDVYDRVKHGFADSAGVKIHYAMLGPTSGSANAPLVLMIHGFPDFWYSWRHQMSVLLSAYQVVAIDLTPNPRS